MRRILPRDAFNDANLLKCIGKLTMDIEDGKCDFIQYHYDGEPFNILQDEASGSTYVGNITFWTKGMNNNIPLYFTRPLNSRESWALYLETEDNAYDVFDSVGEIMLSASDLEQLTER